MWTCQTGDDEKSNNLKIQIRESDINLSFEDDWKNRGEFNKAAENIMYHAELKDGQYNGMGKVFENKVLLYEGELKDGIFEGNGKAFFKSGIIGYEGQWKNGKCDGFGKLYNSYGDIVYEGKWEDGEKID